MTLPSVRHWQFDRPGGPEVLRLVEEPRVEPGFGELRLRVEALSLNRSDLMFLNDAYVEKPIFPSRFGSEVAGMIEAIGPGVEGFAISDRVATLNAFAISQYGTFGETALIPARAVVPVPDRLTAAEAASFGFAYLTNYFALFELGHLKPFQTVLVTAATSTTGLAALPMIRSAGAISIATTRTIKKRDALLAHGADHVVVTDEEDLVARVMEITGGHGADIAYDCVPATMGMQVVNALKRRGDWIVYGFMTEPEGFPWWSVAMRTVAFHLYKVSEFAGNPAIGLPGHEEKFIEAKRTIAAGLKSGRWKPLPIDRQFDGLACVPEALAYMASNQATGKIVVTLQATG